MRKILTGTIAVAVLAHALLAQSAAQGEYDKRRRKALAENGQRHLRLGSWARDRGLVPQATAEFLLAVEVAEGQNPGAVTVLNLMRSLDDRFWTERKQRPSRALLADYEKRARHARREDREARFALAKFAAARKLDDVALRDYRALVGAVDEAIEVDDKGRIVLDVGTVPAEISQQLLAETVTVDTKRYLRDADLRGLPDAATIHECDGEHLRLRGTIAAERLADLHALGTALLPHLEERVGGRPVRRVQVFVFGARAEYAAYLAANALQRYTNASGLADYGAQQAIVCADGIDDERLRGLLLHELAHLYDYQVAPAALPSWYREALAESLGGPGAYQWRDGVLQLGGAMNAAQRARLRDGIDGFSLRALLAADAGALFAADVGRAHRFYVEAWGFFEYLRRDAGDAFAARLTSWEAMCRGKAIGASVREPGVRARTLDESQARAEFVRLFGGDLDALEQGFVAWAKAL